jgi:hypothetical protein
MVICLKCSAKANEADVYCRSCGSEIEFQCAPELLNSQEKFNIDAGASSYINSFDAEKDTIENISFRTTDVTILAMTAAVVLVFAAAFILLHITGGGSKFIGTGSNNRFIESGDWTYYTFLTYESSHENRKMGIYKLDKSGSEQTKVYEDYASSIAVKDDWIYYSGINDMGKLHKIRTDGSDKQLVLEGIVQNFLIKDDYLIYRMQEPADTLYRMNLKDNSKLELGKDVLNFCIVDNTIYYSSAASLGKVLKMNIDGTKSKEICSVEGPILYADNNYIYFADINLRDKLANIATKNKFEENSGKIYRMNLDGSNKKMIIPFEVNNFIIANSYFYYCKNYEDKAEIYRMKVGSKMVEKILSNAYLMGASTDWIYYMDMDSSQGGLYRMSVDGKHNQKLGS